MDAMELQSRDTAFFSLYVYTHNISNFFFFYPWLHEVEIVTSLSLYTVGFVWSLSEQCFKVEVVCVEL